MGAFVDDKLVSIITIHVYKFDDEYIKQLNLPVNNEKLFLRLTKRVEYKEFKETRLAEFLATFAWKTIVDIVKPQCIFICLSGEHKKLNFYYTSFGFTYYEKKFIFILNHLLSNKKYCTIFIRNGKIHLTKEIKFITRLMIYL